VTVAKAGVEPEPHWVASVPFAELRQHVLRARVHGHAQRHDPLDRRRCENVGGVHDFSGRLPELIAGSQRSIQLAERHTVHQRTFAAQQTLQVQVAAGLLRKAHAIEVLQTQELPAQNIRVVHVYGRAELAGDAQQLFFAGTIHVTAPVAPPRGVSESCHPVAQELSCPSRQMFAPEDHGTCGDAARL
jgi:hypothetical protein